MCSYLSLLMLTLYIALNNLFLSWYHLHYLLQVLVFRVTYLLFALNTFLPFPVYY